MDVTPIVSLRTVLEKRIDPHFYASMFPEHAYSLLKRLDEAEIAPVQCDVLEAFSIQEILETPQRRNIILDALEVKEVLALLEFSGRDTVDASKSFARYQKEFTLTDLKALYRLFGYTWEEHHYQINPSEEKESVKHKPITIRPRFGLYPYQYDALQRVEKTFRHAKLALLHMPTGSGKTRTAMAIVCHHLIRHRDGLVVWLADTKELCEQAFDEFQRSWSMLGDRKVTAYPFFDQHEVKLEDVTQGFLVLGLQAATFASHAFQKRGINFFQKMNALAPLVVFDEAHKAIARQYGRVFRDLVNPLAMDQGARGLGLTATPGRSIVDDEANRELVNLFQRNIISLRVEGYDNPISYLQEEGYLAKPTFRALRSDFSLLSVLGPKEKFNLQNGLNRMLQQKLEAAAAKDKRRGFLVIKEALELAKNHKRILLFAANVEQAKRLAFVLKNIGYDARALTSDRATSELRAKTIGWFLRTLKRSPEVKILVNYGMLTTGFDAPLVSAVLIARPTISLVLYSQMVGRGLRGSKVGGTRTCEIVTVVDSDLAEFWDIKKAFTYWDSAWKN